MIRKCAWCDIEMKDAFAESCSENTISHGICPECSENILGSMISRVPLLSLLDRLDAAVVLVDDDVIIKSANIKAQEFMHKNLQDILGIVGGNVFECIFADLPEGCGKTIHCDGCTIRNTVMDTHQTGKCNLNVPAILNRGTNEKSQEIGFIISTEKVGHNVLLKIDSVENG